MGEILIRRDLTSDRLKTLRNGLSTADERAKGKACVYATGSFGRGEANPQSDLDLFIVGKRNGKLGPRGVEGSLLSRLDDICIKAELIEVTRSLGIPEFSGDGKYLVHYSVDEFTKALGTPQDDSSNTFTARLLLLLESKPLVEEDAYKEIIEDVVTAYWRDYADHKASFVPAFLANDILRLWRTFCVNYEARTERVPDEEKIEGKIKNYKLKHSRMLTCYSALLYLLAVFVKEQTVSPSDAMAMSALTPTERLEWICRQDHFSSATETISALLAQYEKFLESTSGGEADLRQQFEDKKKSQKYMDASYEFGDLVFKVMSEIGQETRFFRLLVV